MNKLNVAVAFASAVALSGCAMAAGGNTGAMGIIYSEYKAGGNVGVGQGGSKSGQACVTSILGVVATGDASLAAAKAAGGISTISHVDHDNFGILGLYAKSCTIVVGD